MLAVGDERFLARQAVGVALFDGFGFDALNVRSCRGFGHGQSADHFARTQLWQPALFLLFRAIGQDVVGHDARVDAVSPACQIGAGSFHQDDRLVAEVTTGAAVFFGDRGAKQAEFGGLLPDAAIHLTVLAPFAIARDPAFVDEACGHICEHFMLVCHPA